MVESVCRLGPDGDGGTSMTLAGARLLSTRLQPQPGQWPQQQQLLATLRGGRLPAARSLAHVASCCTLCIMLDIVIVALCCTIYVCCTPLEREVAMLLCTVSLLVALCLCHSLMQCSL